ncbi:MAG: hypothetical protein M0Z54_05465 [Thermaerobacter sp.]|nr:hypothetical protein [Thermaerobacter sp.]
MELVALVLGAAFCGVFLVWPITRGCALAKKLGDQQAQQMASLPKPPVPAHRGPAVLVRSGPVGLTPTCPALSV